MNSLPSFPTFDYDVDKTNAGLRWEKYLSRLENLFVGMNLKDESRKRALLLHYVGEDVYDIYEAEKGDNPSTYEATKQVLTSYFKPKRNVQMEIFNFRSCKQKANQSLDDFVTELRKLAKNCEFTNTDAEILSQIIQHCSSSRLRKRALREPNKSLTEIIELGRSLELADTQAAAIEDEAVNSIEHTHYRKPSDRHEPNTVQHSDKTKTKTPFPHQHVQKTCRNCGGQYPHQTVCPARGNTCNYCGKLNHFRSVCYKLKNKQQVQMVADDQSGQTDSDDSDYCYTIHSQDHTVNTVKHSLPQVAMKLNDTPISLLIDTGSTVNIIGEDTHKKIGSLKIHKTQSLICTLMAPMTHSAYLANVNY